MNMQQEMRTNRRLWLMFSVIAFVLLGFVSVHVEGVEYKAGPSWYWGIVATCHLHWEWWRVPLIIIGFGVALAIPSSVFGWVAQAIVVAVRLRVTQLQPATNHVQQEPPQES